jgi:hypothetical protein
MHNFLHPLLLLYTFQVEFILPIISYDPWMHTESVLHTLLPKWNIRKPDVTESLKESCTLNSIPVGVRGLE